ncbi:hypothetical protein M408DRAFT_326594 [Serendipita vermifera MAFF 305830]|uniref:Uncharacterized protein n=1 Tax=Serendipita vermifera MAFF 305830 TaxID=933852 RepID=A0A0C3B7T0_SERVB|nr:hypothetical protein M408DRAFT_326594 [Serendipita vermifera MAFF 305830]
MTVHVLDPYYLAITVLVTTAYQLSGFAIAWTFQFDKITDFTGGSNFFILALLTLLLGQTSHPRNVIVSVCVMIWAVRIAGFLLYRVLKTGSDNRFDDIRSKFLSFLGFWIGQILWVWVVSLPVTVLNSPSVTETPVPAFGTPADIAGLVIWVIGWLMETQADIAKFRWKMTKPPKWQVMQSGSWRWSRHPPYFGEIMCWWGIWAMSISPSLSGSTSQSAQRAQYAALASPLFTMTLLIFASGIPTAEKPQAKRIYVLAHKEGASEDETKGWTAYKEYLRSTSILVPIPRTIYRPLPTCIKRWVLLDLPMFHFDEKTDGPKALEESRGH